MKLSQLLDYQNACLENNIFLEFLDTSISVDQHSFNEIIILIIAKLFPNIERLIINTQDLSTASLQQRLAESNFFTPISTPKFCE